MPGRRRSDIIGQEMRGEVRGGGVSHVYFMNGHGEEKSRRRRPADPASMPPYASSEKKRHAGTNTRAGHHAGWIGRRDDLGVDAFMSVVCVHASSCVCVAVRKDAAALIWENRNCDLQNRL